MQLKVYDTSVRDIPEINFKVCFRHEYDRNFAVVSSTTKVHRLFMFEQLKSLKPLNKSTYTMETN